MWYVCFPWKVKIFPKPSTTRGDFRQLYPPTRSFLSIHLHGKELRALQILVQLLPVRTSTRHPESDPKVKKCQVIASIPNLTPLPNLVEQHDRAPWENVVENPKVITFFYIKF